MDCDTDQSLALKSIVWINFFLYLRVYTITQYSRTPYSWYFAPQIYNHASLFLFGADVWFMRSLATGDSKVKITTHLETSNM